MPKYFIPVIGSLLLMSLTGCEAAKQLDLLDLRFILLFVLLLMVALTVIASYKGGNK